MPGVVFLSGGQTELGMFYISSYKLNYQNFRCHQKLERNEQNSGQPMETVIQLLTRHPSFRFGCVEGECLRDFQFDKLTL